MKQHEQASILLKKARNDETLLEEVLATERVSDDIIGFHCQQAIEKLLKALLSLHGIRYRKTHDLRELMDLLADTGHAIPNELQHLDMLSPYASLLRYEVMPCGASLDRSEALESVRCLREWVEPQVHQEPKG